MIPDNRFAVRSEEIETKLRELASMIGSQLPEGWGFNLLLFSYGEGGNLFYISSAEREDTIKVMKEFISRQTM